MIVVDIGIVTIITIVNIVLIVILIVVTVVEIKNNNKKRCGASASSVTLGRR